VHMSFTESVAANMAHMRQTGIVPSPKYVQSTNKNSIHFQDFMLQVLMVDDDPGQLRLRQAILSNAGVTVHIATNAESALAFLRTVGNKIGVVVTDHFLTGRTGADLVREMRCTLPSMPVLVLSGMPGIEDEYDGLDVSVRLKPFPPDEFIGFVLNSLSSPKKELARGELQ